MAKISFQRPMDQPAGVRRLIEELRNNLRSSEYVEFRLIVAFAKLGPLLRLYNEIERWNRQGKSIRAIFGVDQKGTSIQALEFALANFKETFVAHTSTIAFDLTFHPKIYIFSGDNKALGYIGSNNLTVGGTETNFECFTKVELELPADESLKNDLFALWDDTIRTTRPLNRRLISKLVNANMLQDERKSQRTQISGESRRNLIEITRQIFPVLSFMPPSTIPRLNIKSYQMRTKSRKLKQMETLIPLSTDSIGAKALVIQIVPHHNGEIFLSKLAINQEPAFFGWPFTGKTLPKRKSNPSYPQRVPDPVVDLKVFDNSGLIVIRHYSFNLNTVYYSKKSEIRITVQQDIVSAVPPGPPYSIMVMKKANEPLDYTIDIYLPGSPLYDKLFRLCNQTMPSGGKLTPRLFGWL